MTTRVSTASAAVFAALAQPLAALAQQTDRWSGHWHTWSGATGSWWLVPFITLIAVAVGAALLLTRASRPGREPPQDDPVSSALRILNERFARGEIAPAEYEERKRALFTIMTPGGQV